MGRHSSAQPELRHHQTPASAIEPAVRLTRGQERAIAKTRARRATVHRYTAIPTACGVLALALYLGDETYHFMAPAASASTDHVGPDASDLSALATGSQAASLLSGAATIDAGLAARPTRVSRFKRTAMPAAQTLPAATAAQTPTAATAAQTLTATALPARPGLPKLDPYKTVAGTWVRPSEGDMSSCFCMRWSVFHEGIDLAGPLGSPIVAAGAGLVLEAGPAAGFGHWIVIQQSNGDVTIYGHMFTVLVSKGQRVTTGQHIANIGDDGEATGPHLHFGVRRGGIDGPYIDPVPWLRARGVSVGTFDPNA